MINNIEKLRKLRLKLKSLKCSIGTWMQIPSTDIAEILSNTSFDWIALDMEHGSFDISNLTDILRSIELGNAISLIRMQDSSTTTIKKVLDCGASGIIIPNIENSDQLKQCIDSCNWPPYGKRGVGFSRANLFGKKFKEYKDKKEKPLVVAIIESKKGYENLEEIIKVKGLDCVFIGPYDLSASFNILGKFETTKFKKIISTIKNKCKTQKIPCGIHVVKPNLIKLNKVKKEFQFIAYSIDAQFILEEIKKFR